MDIPETTIEDLDASQQVTTAGGAYPEFKLACVYGLAIGAGVMASAGLLGPAFVVGGALLLSEAW